MKHKIITIGFILYIVFFSVVSLVAKDKEFSQMENRYLNKMPEFTFQSLVKGGYTSDIEKYLSDHIILKDQLVSLKTDTDFLMNKKKINGVYLGKEGYFIQSYDKPGAQLTKNLTDIQKFVTNHSDQKINLLLAPNVSQIYPEYVPNKGICYDQQLVLEQVKKELQGVTIIDPTDNLLKHKEESIYFKTDHHWTMRGAYYGYAALADQLKWNLLPIEDYEGKTVANEFYGSLYSKAPASFIEPDKVEVFKNPNGTYKVEYVDKNRTSNQLFEYDNLKIKDKYTFFLDGNHSMIKIYNKSANQNKKLLILKDSYAHNMIPFIADEYSEIVVLDLRYYHDGVSKYLKEHKIDEILFVYNVDFLSSDNNFIWLND